MALLELKAFETESFTRVVFTYAQINLLNFICGKESQKGIKMMKKFGSKSIALLMSLLMVFSIFAPVIASATEYIDEHEDKVINYVSIGDSMVNGFGLDGYEKKS